jgi:hypothetical protein
MEVEEELLAIQLSRNSRTASFKSAKTLSTLLSAGINVIDFTDLSSELQPALKVIAADEYEKV